jgi:hypothetical protein
LATVVNETVSLNFNSLNANSGTMHAASVAYPGPHTERARRQPISTQGVK